jgi:hypothetical protein
VSVWHKFVMISIGQSGNKAFVVVYEITGHDFFIRRAAVVCVWRVRRRGGTQLIENR